MSLAAANIRAEWLLLLPGAAQMNEPRATAQGATPPCILIVDDEESILVALRETLELEGYAIHTFTDPALALEAVTRQTFAVILSDQKMPGLSGLDFLGHVRGLQPEATRILITGVLSLDTVLESINKGEIYRFIVKPWFREELLITIRNAVQRHELICRNASLQARTSALNLELTARVTELTGENQELARVNLSLGENLNRALEFSLRMLEEFLPALARQGQKARQVCGAMSEVLQLPPEEARVLEISARFHDVGMIGIPRSVIVRWFTEPGSLDASETGLLRQHPVIGHHLVRFARPLDGIGLVIRGHHERVDGGGYPDGLVGEAIPWLARLLAVSVAYASSAQERSATLETIQLQAGSAFDPEAVRALIRAAPRISAAPREHQVLVSELKPGMRLARGIYSATGVLLLPEGQCLTETTIERVVSQNREQRVNESLLVYG